MAKKTYIQTINNTLERCRDVLTDKEQEYASVMDRFHNFKLAASIQGITPRAALAGMMAKHTVSIYDMCISNSDYTLEQWDEKICDNINYLLLLRAMVEVIG